MSKPLKGIVFTHSSVSESLVQAVRDITGDDESLIAVSNAGMGRDLLCKTVGELIEEQPAVVFVDLPGGSCLQSVMQAARDRGDVALVTGVNLPMLLDFVFNRNVTPVEAAERAAETGTTAIRAIGS